MLGNGAKFDHKKEQATNPNHPENQRPNVHISPNQPENHAENARKAQKPY